MSAGADMTSVTCVSWSLGLQKAGQPLLLETLNHWALVDSLQDTFYFLHVARTHFLSLNVVDYFHLDKSLLEAVLKLFIW